MRRRKRFSVDTRKVALRIGLCIVAMAAVGLMTFFMRQRSGLPPWRTPKHVPPYYDTVEAAKPFPSTAPPSMFTDRKAIRAYTIAREMPGILVQQPCYCGCARLGHKSLLACFSSDHGANCGVCIKEAYLADTLSRAGKSAAYIRSSIIAGKWWSVKLE